MPDIGGCREGVAVIEGVKAIGSFHPGIIQGVRQFVEGEAAGNIDAESPAIALRQEG